MRSKQLFISLTLGLGLTLALLWLLGGTRLPAAQAAPPQCPNQSPLLQAGDVITVCLSGGCDYTSIQDAVDAANPGDEILVAAGTYTGVSARTGVTQVVYISKTVTIRGGYNADFSTRDPDTYSTTLDAQGQGRVLYITGNISPTIEGLRITGGDATGLGGGLPVWGEKDVGGGLYLIGDRSVISNNLVFSNIADYGGGLFLLSGATLSGNTVASNTAEYGGGLYATSSGVTISNNLVFNNTVNWYGGGLYLSYSIATLSGNTVVSNSAGYGGGLFLGWSIATLSRDIVISNTAEYGGGLYLLTSATLTNIVIADNQTNTAGSGLYVRGSSPRLLHSTFARNRGGDGSGVHITSDGGNYSTVALTNTILVSHSVGISVTGGNTVTVNGVLWYGTPVTVSQAATATVTVQNQHEGDPAFAADGYHLMGDSTAIDQGVNAGVTTDIDGQSRDAIPDLGADEFVGVTPVYLPLIMRQYQ